jgi:2-keto-4-pentenoate hydratase/2-oxohepta-3-ene-1,7-dioic acid hydratase in catechol pathway
MGKNLVAFLAGEERPVDDAPVPLTSLRPGPPIALPTKIVGVGLNYRDHAEESGQPVPDEPVIFAKFANSVIGPGDPIVIPPAAERIDFEAELGVVIGRRARRIQVAHALDVVGGYTCVNDVSSRALQFSGPQWTLGKAIDTFLPSGPWLVTADEVPDPQTLAISCTVNGETVQSSNTAQMVFGVAELVAFLSRTMTLEPGDMIATGTPPGVGFARTPPRFLDDGDVVTVEIDRVGTLTNPVTRERD